MTDTGAPLLPIVAIPPGHLPATPPGFARQSLNLCILALTENPLGICATVTSALVCWVCGYAEVSVIDPLIFKSIFIIFGFTMGFRNVRANQRCFEAMQHAHGLFMAIWGIYSPMPLKSRLRIRDELLESMKAIAAHIHRVGAHRRNCWYGMLGLQPATAELESESAEIAKKAAISRYGAMDSSLPKDASLEAEDGARTPSQGDLRLSSGASVARTMDNQVSSFTYALVSPLPRLLDVLMACEEELERIEQAPAQKLRRGFWFHKPQVLTHYEMLLSLSFPSVPDRFMCFVDVCLGFFAVSLPWGITCSPFHIGKVSINTGVVLVFNTTLVVMVMFCLNGLTVQNEDPLSGDGDDLNLNSLASAFTHAIMSHDEHEGRKQGSGAEERRA